jgi:PmbA protein
MVGSEFMTSKNQSEEHLSVLADVIAAAKKGGAEQADAMLVTSDSLGVSCRLGAMEDLERSEGTDVGLRVLIGKQQAVVSTSDLSASSLRELSQRAIDMARHAPEDPWCGLANESEIARSFPADLDLFDPTEPDADGLFQTAKTIEDAARAVEGITNSEGASASWGRASVALMTSHGFAGGYQATSQSAGVSVIAGEGTGMERDYEYTSARHLEDLDSPEEIGQKASEKTLRRLNPQNHETCKVPVIFDPRVGASLLGHLSGAINGASVARGTSFLKDAMDTQIFSDGINIIDDPLRKRGLRSKAFDGEGIATRINKVIDQGQLRSWFLESSTARQLGLPLTGSASRGTNSVPGAAPTNLYMAAGNVSPEDLMSDIQSGFYVTELIGMGVNGVNGDYSRGASGFWIENGKIGGPVSGMTIAGNLKDIYLNLTPADDLKFKYGTNVPTLRLEGLTLAGA